MIDKKRLGISVVIAFVCLFSVSVFGQVDIPRQTKAITYPLDAEVVVQFRGTTRFPRMKGEAKIERTKKNGTEIKLSVSKMPRPFELGAGYATYVLWAISPNGQVDNLGEIKRRGFWEFDSNIKVTTPLQTFALIITAEPHFLVTRPSQEIMLENLSPYSVTGRTIPTMTSISYFGNSSDYFRDARTPQIADVDYRKTPTTILQARQAIALARFAGAERDASEELQQAEVLLKNAVGAWEAGRDEEYIDLTARKAISQAVQAETTALVRSQARENRNEKIRRDAELRDAEDKFVDAQNDITDLKSQLASETRARELAERDKMNYLEQIKDLKDEVTRLRRELLDAKTELAAIAAREKTLEAERERARKLERLEANSAVLMQSLGRFGDVEKSDEKIVLTLPENYWSGIRVSAFAATGDSKVADLAQVLANSPDYRILIESHTDNDGTPDELQVLTQERAQAVADKFMSQGVTPERMEVRAYGATMPLVANTTRSNRDKNRRVRVILTPSVL